MLEFGSARTFHKGSHAKLAKNAETIGSNTEFIMLRSTHGQNGLETKSQISFVIHGFSAALALRHEPARRGERISPDRADSAKNIRVRLALSGRCTAGLCAG